MPLETAWLRSYLMLTTTAPLDPELLAGLETLVARQRTLEEVIAWALACKPPRQIERVVVQDEYTHDVVLRYGEGVYLVYDTT